MSIHPLWSQDTGLVWHTPFQAYLWTMTSILNSQIEKIKRKILSKFKRPLDIPVFFHWEVIEIQNFPFKNLVLSTSSLWVSTNIYKAFESWGAPVPMNLNGFIINFSLTDGYTPPREWNIWGTVLAKRKYWLPSQCWCDLELFYQTQRQHGVCDEYFLFVLLLLFL